MPLQTVEHDVFRWVRLYSRTIDPDDISVINPVSDPASPRLSLPTGSTRWRLRHIAPLVVLAICVVATLLLCTHASTRADEQRVRANHALAEEFAQQMEQRFVDYERVLIHSRGLYNASERVTRADWKRYVDSSWDPGAFPGVFGFAFVQRVHPDEMDEFLAETRADGAPDFEIKYPTGTDRLHHTGDRYIIKYHEPRAINRSAWGLDLAARSVNADVYERARDSGMAAVSMPMRLHQAGESEWGLVMCLPVYETASIPETIEQRRDSLIGWVATPIGMSSFAEAEWAPSWLPFRTVLASAQNGETLELVDLTDPRLPELAQDQLEQSQDEASAFRIALGDQSFVLTMYPKAPSLFAGDRTSEMWYLAGGLVFSLLVTAIVWSATRTRERAVRIAQEMTETIRASSVRQRELAASALAANRAKSEFLANMSHEIRTPMTAILGYTEILGSIELSTIERNNAINAVERSGQHLLRLINDVLDLSRIEAGQMTIQPAPCDLSTVVLDVIDGLRARADQFGLSMDAEITGSVPPSIVVDEQRLRQILINLVGNALKFTESGSVVLRVSADRDTIRFSVVDTGIGIPADSLDRVFNAFEQANNSASRAHEGTGLGLAISRKLSRAMGGTLHAQSAPGSGSTFTLIIPLQTRADTGLITEFQRPEPVVKLAEGDSAQLRGKILLAEDGEDNQRLIAFHLGRAGLDIEIVCNGREVVDRFDAGEHYDAVIMDMQMPEMDGYAASRLLRAKGCDWPILALTAHAMAGDRQKCIEAGCSDYQTKPINRIKLVEAIATLIAASPSASRAA